MSARKNTTRDDIITKLENQLPSELISKLPHRWWFVGDILIITIHPELLPYKQLIGDVFLEIGPKKVRSVLGKTGPTLEVIRTPKYELLAGDENTETIHKELGCQYLLDASKLTFSPGNLGERKRLLNITMENEYIIDMFTCIGNLSMPLAVHKKPKKVIGAEINPIAYDYLLKTISLNKVEGIMEGLLGDNRKVLSDYFGLADRVLMGYLECDEEQISIGIQLCKSKGIIHYHEAIPAKKGYIEKIFVKLNSIAGILDRNIKVQNYRTVKKYSPGINHIDIDAQII
ncbi:MAG: class I SAM-dependent methyltransferase family protein [Asgard group archaeon]|nr:class I SAM-dependent methyltransferase family protein [Asgard group archaeon]